jgi:hypothetical protein
LVSIDGEYLPFGSNPTTRAKVEADDHQFPQKRVRARFGPIWKEEGCGAERYGQYGGVKDWFDIHDLCLHQKIAFGLVEQAGLQFDLWKLDQLRDGKIPTTAIQYVITKDGSVTLMEPLPPVSLIMLEDI